VKRLLDQTSRVQHWLAATLSVWLIATSPWISMRRIVPENPTFWDWTHIVVGLALVVIGIAYLATNFIDGRWREQFPWAAGNLSGVHSDLKAIGKLKVPSAGGAGLFSLIQGLLLVMLLATALTGFGWLVADGSRAALAWREWHMLVANVFAWLLVLHVAASALHLLDFLRD
jgi:cytochrome b561